MRNRAAPNRARLRRNLFVGIGEAMLATPWIFLMAPGNFVMAALLTQYFGLEKAAYGGIVALPALANAVQIVIVPWLTRFLTPKDLAVGLGWFNLGLWLMLANSLGHLPREDPRGAAVFFGVFFVFSSLSGAFLGIGWTAWVRNWVPRAVQGGYFGSRNRWISLVTLACLAAAMGLFAAAEGELWPLQALCVMAVAMRFGSLVWQNTIHAEGDHRPASPGQPWAEQLGSCLRTPGLMRFVLVSAWIGFWLAFVGPFVPVFCFEELRVQPWQFSLFVLLSTASAMAGWVFWGKLAGRHGSIPVLAIRLLLWEVSNLLWLALTPESAWLLYPMWIWGGFVSVSCWLCSFNLLLNLLPKDARIVGSSLNPALTSVAAALAPLASGFLLDHFLAGAPDTLAVYRAGFGVKSAAVLASFPAFGGLREPHRTARTTAPGAFTTLRLILSSLGPGFLASIIPQRKRK